MSEAKITEAGKTCIRLVGRFAGRKGVITKLLDDNFVEVTYELGKGKKTKKTNIKHLVILNEKAEEKSKPEKKK
ncbi:MAG: 50S ribosomal protein L14e [Candidatus Nanohalarchaeota archaeon]|nr:MAG: 50S ribosomal protein L14e [Candidatus Nanohaloarchaeota archaeon]